jgi:hypothetical protein
LKRHEQLHSEELSRFHTDRVRQLGAYLCGRRLYETMVYVKATAADLHESVTPARDATGD